MISYYDTAFNKKFVVCDDGCSVGRFSDIVKKQCENNLEKKCLFLIHNEHCICNKGRLTNV